MFSVYLSVISACVSVLVVSTDGAEQASSTHQVSRLLVLGGNGFMGSSLVTRLLSTSGIRHVTILNRGNWYFDSRSRVEPYVESLRCDRTDIYACTELIQSTHRYEAVIDFTSYHAEDLKAIDFYGVKWFWEHLISCVGSLNDNIPNIPMFFSAEFVEGASILDVLRGRYGRYIFISSDSVYEVCVENTHGGPSRERDAIRPSHPEERHALNRKDWYGHRKLECEEILEWEHQAHGIHYVSLRLPDVIGPRDSTDRFWNYQIWLQSHHLRGSLGPVHLNPKKNKLLSFVYSEDVSNLILELLDSTLDVYNEAYNVAFEPMTLEGFLKTMAESLGINDVVFDRSEDGNLHWYPSVTRGPVNVTKISQNLSWRPSPLREAMRSSCRFYREAMHVPEYQTRRDKIMKRYVHDRETWKRFLREQGVSLGLHDEL